jgi:hypothetical protein
MPYSALRMAKPTGVEVYDREKVSRLMSPAETAVPDSLIRNDGNRQLSWQGHT